MAIEDNRTVADSFVVVRGRDADRGRGGRRRQRGPLRRGGVPGPAPSAAALGGPRRMTPITRRRTDMAPTGEQELQGVKGRIQLYRWDTESPRYVAVLV